MNITSCINITIDSLNLPIWKRAHPFSWSLCVDPIASVFLPSDSYNSFLEYKGCGNKNNKSFSAIPQFKQKNMESISINTQNKVTTNFNMPL